MASLVTDSLRSYEQRDIQVSRVRRRSYQRWRLLRSGINLYYFWEKRWFFIALVIGFVLIIMPQPEGLTR